ncbi:MAG: LemA family protein [Treponema sp.]|nr:LemA family protein [Treponema sp.]
MSTPLIIIIAILVLLVLWVIITYNGFIRIRNKFDESFATMDVYLKKRFDLIPNLVATVKGYAKHEAETLEKVIEARNAGTRNTVDEKVEDENQITGAIRQIFALGESYPELKANTNFQELQKQLSDIEEDIANSRKYYNAIVKQFNTKCQTIPSNIIAKIFGFKPLPMFTVDSEEERQNVKVEF